MSLILSLTVPKMTYYVSGVTLNFTQFLVSLSLNFTQSVSISHLQQTEKLYHSLYAKYKQQ